MKIAIALVCALLSTTLINLAYMREQQAASALPKLSARRLRRSVGLLLSDRGWMRGFAMESSGFLLYATALAFAPLALVQSVAAGGIGVLAYASSRIGGRRLSTRAVVGVALSVAGLVALAISLLEGGGNSREGDIGLILMWLGGTAVAATLVLLLGRRRLGVAVANGIAGGLFFSVGDISTKLTTHWGPRSAFVVTVIAGYLLGTALLQAGYQAGSALTVAGIATLLTNVLPIAAGTIVLEEPVPSGALGVARVLAFAAVTVGAVLLARPPGSHGAPG